MYKYILILLYLQFIRAQYYPRYRSLGENYDTYSSNEEYYQPPQRKFKFTRNAEMTDKTDYDYNNNLEEKSTANSLANDVQATLTSIKSKLNEKYRKLTSLDQQNQDIAKKTITETRDELDNRVGYVEQLLYKKREGAMSSNANVMRCVSESLAKLGKITPTLMRDEEQCIGKELEMSRAVAKVTMDVLKEHMQKVKYFQERVNKCTSLIKRRKTCLINLVHELTFFKSNIKTTVNPKMSETANYLNGVSSRTRKCTMAIVARVVTHAGDVIVNFNTCMQGAAAGEEKKKKNEMLLFVV